MNELIEILNNDFVKHNFGAIVSILVLVVFPLMLRVIRAEVAGQLGEVKKSILKLSALVEAHMSVVTEVGRRVELMHETGKELKEERTDFQASHRAIADAIEKIATNTVELTTLLRLNEQRSEWQSKTLETIMINTAGCE